MPCHLLGHFGVESPGSPFGNDLKKQRDSLYRRGVLRGPGWKVPHGVLFERFWAPASECPQECFSSALWPFSAPKTPKNTQKALFGALRGRCPKSLKKHSVGHFPARAPEHSCKRQPGSQRNGIRTVSSMPVQKASAEAWGGEGVG